MAPNAANRKSIREAEKTARLIDHARGEVLTQIMDTMAGRAWMHDLLATCHIFQTPFTGEALTSAFAAGEQNIGQQLLAGLMTHCPQTYITMMSESNARSAAASERTRSPDPDGGDQAGDPPSGPEPTDRGAGEGGTEAARFTDIYRLLTPDEARRVDEARGQAGAWG